jgi:predicted GTPase
LVYLRLNKQKLETKNYHMTPEQFREEGKKVIDWIADYYQEIEKYPPPAWKGKYIKIKYVTQLPTKNPVFAFFCNLPQYIKEPYTRYLENRLRENFDFEGVPIKIVYKNK